MGQRVFKFALSIFLSFLILSSVQAATLPGGFTETQITGLSNPTAMTFAPDGRLFVCQQGGQLRVIKNGALLSTPFLTVTVDSNGERGLLGVAFDPNFAANQFVYIYYTATTPQVHNRISRFTANGDVAVAGSEVVLLDLNNLSSATNHNGGAIHFGLDGKLYAGVGENANGANAQTLTNLLGKVLRINSDGTIPSDNPTSFPGVTGTTSGVNRAIWALGLRNPFTFAVKPETGRLFINDVGQSAWEEIDDGIAGSNYGWAICEGTCSNAGFTNPLFQYGHGSTSTTGCAIAGGAFYNPATARFPAAYINTYFFADLCTGWIRRYDPATGAVTDFASGISSPVDLQVSADGALYYLARGTNSVFRITYTLPLTTNPVEDAQFFVRQHYADFLGREPDAGGLNYWTTQITQCGSNTSCIRARRIDVSAAFFIETEFQETGSFVYRIYKASLGRRPTYAEFTTDRGKVVGGSNLEASKTAFANEWVTRAAFLQAYPATMSNDQFVNKLFDTAGLFPYTIERLQEINAMNGGRTRAQALRDVIEIQEFKTREYNPAFVLMQYYGYLRRDIDQAGYDFWLDILTNREPQNYRGMVCSFLTSAEYQDRFSTVHPRSNAECGS
ncbi:MAG: PQQ-dependent sugar dehydrogenase [Pyrinomonadaceae bacterium]